MESPGGNVSQFAEALTAYTDTSRNFIDTFVRRGWLLGVRVDVVKSSNDDQEACLVW
jgi:DNA-binding winged helix-turn-helix (wHTH) protein